MRLSESVSQWVSEHLRMRAMVVSATSTDSSCGSSWMPLGKRRFSMTTVTSRLSVSSSSTLQRHLQVLLCNSSSSNDRKWREKKRAVPSVSRGLHDELQVVSTLPPAAGVSEVHFLPVLGHRQVVDEGQPPAADHVPAGHETPRLSCVQTTATTSRSI